MGTHDVLWAESAKHGLSCRKRFTGVFTSEAITARWRVLNRGGPIAQAPLRCCQEPPKLDAQVLLT